MGAPASISKKRKMLGSKGMAALFRSLFQPKPGDNAIVANHDWSQLPYDLIFLLCTTLSEISDAVCFRLVCRAWRLATSLLDSAPFLPWILIENNPLRVNDGDLQFYSPFTGKSYNIHVPQAAGATLVGPANGYLVSFNYDNRSLSILNPLIGHEISLPPLKGGDALNPLTVFITQNDNQFKIMLVNLKDEYLHTQSLQISRPMDNEWKLTKLRCSIHDKYGAFVFYNNMYFVTELSEGRTTILDMTGNFVTKIPDNMTKKGDKIVDYLVESGGKLYRILINMYYNSREQFSIDVNVLNVDKGYKWLEIKHLDDHTLFLDLYGSSSVLSNKLHGLRGNCIYFFTHGFKVNNAEHSRCFLHQYELGNGNIQNIEFPFQHCGTWIFPSMCQLTS